MFTTIQENVRKGYILFSYLITGSITNCFVDNVSIFDLAISADEMWKLSPEFSDGSIKPSASKL